MPAAASLALAGARLLSGQVPFDPAAQPDVAALVGARQPHETSVACDVNPMPAHMDFGFRFQSGYMLHVPLKQYAGEGNGFAVVTRFTPDGARGESAYFSQTVELPKVPARTRTEARVGGSYYLGEGRYGVDFLLLDSAGRTCRKHWRVEARRSNGERNIPMTVEANSVEPAQYPGWRPPDARMAPPLSRITVLLHVAPLFQNSTGLRGYDQALLLSSVVSLLRQMRAGGVTLVAFNLDQQKEIFRQDNLDEAGWDSLVDAVNGLELGTVPYSVLTRKSGHVDLLRQLLDEQLTSKNPADAVIVLGPTARQDDRYGPAESAREPGAHPPLFYFEYRPFFNRSGEFPDVIYRAVRALAGKAYRIHSPGEFASAIREVQTRVAGREAAVGEGSN